MSKTYILQKDFLYSNGGKGCVHKGGTKLKKDDEGDAYYRFESGEVVWHEMVENNPEWFLPEENKGGKVVWQDDINGDYVFASPDGTRKTGKLVWQEENKSNDSFQWTDEKVFDFYHTWFPLYAKPEKTLVEYINEFKEWRSPIPKPQAEQYDGSFKGKRFIDDEVPQWAADKMDFKKFWANAVEKSKPQAENKPEKGMNLDKEERKFPFGKDKSVTMLPNEAVFPNKPDWEIVAFVMNKSYNIPGGVQPHNFVLEDDGKYHGVWSISLKLDELINHPDMDIHSVKRLSDGEVFDVRGVYYDEFRALKPIKKFFIGNHNVMYAQFDEGYGSNDGCLGLNSLKKLPPQPQKLFTTEDGKDIFEDDRAWYLTKKGVINFYDFVDTKSGNREFELKHYPEEYKYFSTKEAAEKYIADNKPQDHIGIDRNGEDTNDVDKLILEINPEYANLNPATKLYTQQQVDELCEKAVRDAKMELPYAIGRLVEELAKDKSEGSYYYSWQCNIAMAFFDEWNKVVKESGLPHTRVHVHEMSNNAAKKFLDILCIKPQPQDYKNSKQ